MLSFLARRYPRICHFSKRNKSIEWILLMQVGCYRSEELYYGSCVYGGVRVVLFSVFFMGLLVIKLHSSRKARILYTVDRKCT